MSYDTFTVSCGVCGECHRGIGILAAMVELGRHPLALLVPDAAYDRLLAETLADADTILTI